MFGNFASSSLALDPAIPSLIIFSSKEVFRLPQRKSSQTARKELLPA
jgi:hypothetical protein